MILAPLGLLLDVIGILVMSNGDIMREGTLLKSSGLVPNFEKVMSYVTSKH